MPKAKVNYALAGTLVAQGMTLQDAARKVNSANGESLRRGLARKGVTARSARTVDASLIVPRSVTLQVAAEASECLKETFGRILNKHVGKLEQAKPSSNLRKAKQLAEVVEPLARTAKIVYGWGDAQSKGAINVNVLGSVSFDDLPLSGTDVRTVRDTVQETGHAPDTAPAQLQEPEQVK